MSTLAQRMVTVMAEVRSVFKGANIQMGGGRSYSAVSHDDVARLLHTPMATNGIYTKVSVEKVEISSKEVANKFGDIKSEYRADVWVEVTFINSEKPEDREVCKGFAYAFDSGDKAVGKAQSMAVKYVLLKNFVLESTDEEESRDQEVMKTPPKKDIVKEGASKATPAPTAAAPKAAEKIAPALQAPAGQRTASFRKSPTPAAAPAKAPAPAQSQDAEPEIEM